MFHTVNAYDEGDTVVLDVVRHAQMFTDDLYGWADGTGTLDRWTIDLRAGRVRGATDRRPHAGVPTGGRAGPGSPASVRVRGHVATWSDFVEPFGTLLQHDLQSGTTAAAKLGPGRQAGEGVFVPAGGSAAEDEGGSSLSSTTRSRTEATS